MLLYRTAGPGYWTTVLLPLALVLHNHNDRSPIILGILMVNTALLTAFHAFSTENTLTKFLRLLKPANIALSAIAVTYSIAISGEPTPYEAFTYVTLNFAFPYVFYSVIKHFPRSFTFGEAIVVSQGFIFVFWSAVRNIPFPPADLSKASESDIIFIFVQGGFLLVLLATRFLVIAKKPWTFELTEEFFCIWGKCCLLALVLRLSIDDLWFLYGWVVNFFFASHNRTVLFVYCLTLILAACGVVGWKHYSSRHVTTAYRKYFHFLIVAVYLPAILTDINLLHICSAAIMYILIFIEAARFLNLRIFRWFAVGEIIDANVGIFRDQQDEGRLIVTPLYLLAGCSLPIWLIGLQHPSSELSSDALAAAMSGILSIGIGDTFASIGGSMYGRIKWKGTAKSLEGTICSVVSQVTFLFVLIFSGMCAISVPTAVAVFVAVVINALVEGMTDQIDNLVLPLVVFDFVLGANYLVDLVILALTDLHFFMILILSMWSNN